MMQILVKQMLPLALTVGLLLIFSLANIEYNNKTPSPVFSSINCIGELSCCIQGVMGCVGCIRDHPHII